MMRLPEFRYIPAKSADEAAKILADDPHGTRLVAGGTDLWPNMKRRHQSANTVIGLKQASDLRGVKLDSSGQVSVGAMTTLSAICREPSLRKSHPGFVRAVASISSATLRNMGTLGGNLCLDTRCTYYNQNEEWRKAIGYCMKECGETCWVAPSSSRCYAISASDSAPLLCAIGARVRLVSTRGERVIPVADLFQDDGIAYLTKERDEVLTDVFLPAMKSVRSTYWKLRRRGSIDYPVLGVGAAMGLGEDGTVLSATLYLGALTSFPIPMNDMVAPLLGGPITEQKIREVADAVEKASAAFDNTDFDLKWRRHMVGAYVEGAFRELAGLPPRVLPSIHGARPIPV